MRGGPFTRMDGHPQQLDSHSLLPPDARSFRLVSMWPPTYSDTGVFSPEFRGQSWPPPANQCYGTGPVGVDRLVRADRIVAEGRYLRYKLFLADYDLKKLTAHWSEMTGARKKLYVVQTNESVVERCILMTTDPGDLVLDPTCGSGTSAFVAEKWGRRWITCDTSRVALTLAKQRLMTAVFDYYELAYPHPNPLPAGEGARRAGKGAQGVWNGFKYKTVPHVTLKSIANNPDIREGMTRAQIDAAIARHADQETLYDQPLVDRKRTRVSGPFTVEAVPAPAVKSVEELIPSPPAPLPAREGSLRPMPPSPAPARRCARANGGTNCCAPGFAARPASTSASRAWSRCRAAAGCTPTARRGRATRAPTGCAKPRPPTPLSASSSPLAPSTRRWSNASSS